MTTLGLMVAMVWLARHERPPRSPGRSRRPRRRSPARSSQPLRRRPAGRRLRQLPSPPLGAKRRHAGPNLSISINFVNALGGAFRLMELELYLDGTRIDHRAAPSGEELPRRFPIWNGPMTPGPHHLTTIIVLRGRNRGIFTVSSTATPRGSRPTSVSSRGPSAPSRSQ